MSEASKSRQGHGRVPDYMLKNKDETCAGVFGEVTSPKHQDDENKTYWTFTVVPYMLRTQYKTNEHAS